MTTAELAKLADKVGVIEEKGLVFEVRTIDARRAYGRVEVLIEPVAGNGQRWISAAAFMPKEGE